MGEENAKSKNKKKIFRTKRKTKNTTEYESNLQFSPVISTDSKRISYSQPNLVNAISEETNNKGESSRNEDEDPHHACIINEHTNSGDITVPEEILLQHDFGSPIVRTGRY